MTTVDGPPTDSVVIPETHVAFTLDLHLLIIRSYIKCYPTARATPQLAQITNFKLEKGHAGHFSQQSRNRKSTTILRVGVYPRGSGWTCS